MPIDYSGGLTVPGAVAIGTDAQATSPGSVVIGANSIAEAPATNQGASTVIGAYSYAGSNNNVVLGNRGVAIGWAAMAIGRESASTGRNAIAFGNVSAAIGDGAVAMGQSSLASGQRAIAIGSADSQRDYSEDNTQASGTDSLAFGTQAVASEQDAIAFGREAGAAGEQSVAIGTLADAAASRAVAIGNDTQAELSATAIGDQASSVGERSTAIGFLANSQSADSVAIGHQAAATGINGFAMGLESQASGVDSLAVGTGAIASGEQSISIGYQNEVSGDHSGAVGDPNIITGSGSYALGNDNTIDADEAGAFGNRNVLAETATGSRLIGNDNDVDVADAFILGNDADVTEEGGVALGSGSVASTASGIAGYVPEGADDTAILSTTSTRSAISVGDADAGEYRQITGVAAGTEDSDAVNVAQLQGLADTPLTFGGDSGETQRRLGESLNIVGSNANLSTEVTDDDELQIALNDDLALDSVTINDGGPVIDGGGIDMSNTQIVGLADGTEDDHAVNLGQLNEVGDVASQGWDVQTNADASTNVAPGDTVTFLDGQNIEITSDGQEISVATADDVEFSNVEISENLTVEGDTLLEGDLSVTHEGDEVFNITEGDTVFGGDSFTIAENTTIDMSDNRITNVGDAIEEGDAVNLGQVTNLTEEIADTPLTFGGDSGETERRLGETFNIVGSNANLSTEVTDDDELQIALNDDLALDSVTINDGGPVIDGGGIDMGGQQIVGLADGTEDDHAVNLGQLDQSIDESTTRYYSVNDGGVIGDNYDNDGASGVNAMAAGVGASATQEDAVALGREAQANIVGGAALGAESIVDRETAPTDGVIDAGSATITYNTNDQELLGAVSVGRDGEAYRQITNVADGTQNQDAVTIRQLQGAISSVTQTGTLYFHANSADEDGSNDSLAVGEESIAVGPDTIVNADRGIGMGDGALVEATAPGGTAIGQQAYVSLPDAIAMGTESEATGEQSIALGAGAVASDPSSVALGGNAVTSAPVGTSGTTINDVTYEFAGSDPVGTVSVGDEDQERTITNVAAGRIEEDSTDAINGSQLYTTHQAIEETGDLLIEIAGDTSETYVNENGRGIRYARTNENGLAESDAFAQAPGATAVGYEATATAADALALGRDAQADHQGSVALGEGAQTSEAVGTASIDIAGQTYQFAGAEPVATVSVGANGAERTITNVAAGRVSADSTDAINGSQLHATNQAVESIEGRVGEVEGDVTELDNRVTNVEGDVANLGDSFEELNDQAVKYDVNDDGSVNYDSITLEGDEGTTITNVAAGEVSEESSDAVNGSQLWEVQNQVSNIEEGGSKYFTANSEAAAAQAEGDESVAMGPESVAAGDHSVAAGDGARAESEGGVALGAGSVAQREGMDGQEEAFSGESVASTQGAVSVGSEGSERQITNVAGGTEATDAVNVRQLESVQAGSVNYDRDGDGNVDYSSVTFGEEGTSTRLRNISAGVEDSDAVNLGQMRELSQRFEQQIGGVHSRIDDVEDQANAGTASAMAMASVPQAYKPGKSMLAVGAGTYNGESAVSVGASRLSDNGRWAAKLNVSGDSQGNFGAGVGAGFHW
ncbi:YadA-like family protein [Halomonas salipaludis]|uniref:YadA-like family protein n=1 Tax=Halomonas salipaludis TaxID=2032625 RepID=UPI001E2F6D01|nr:YadA-like family protein [Halomonas salipaludis]